MCADTGEIYSDPERTIRRESRCPLHQSLDERRGVSAARAIGAADGQDEPPPS